MARVVRLQSFVVFSHWICGICYSCDLKKKKLIWTYFFYISENCFTYTYKKMSAQAKNVMVEMMVIIIKWELIEPTVEWSTKNKMSRIDSSFIFLVCCWIELGSFPLTKTREISRLGVEDQKLSLVTVKLTCLCDMQLGKSD